MNPEYSTAIWKLILMNLFLKVKSLKEDMESSIKDFGEKQLLLSKCSKYSQKVQSEISSVSVQLWRLSDILM